MTAQEQIVRRGVSRMGPAGFRRHIMYRQPASGSISVVGRGTMQQHTVVERTTAGWHHDGLLVAAVDQFIGDLFVGPISHLPFNAVIDESLAGRAGKGKSDS